MTPQEANDLVQTIFDRIFDSVTKAEVGGKALKPAASTVLSLMKPGLAINSKDFRNPWTPGNSSGSKDAALNTAMLVDVAPKLSSLYTNSGNEISKVYGDILSSVQIAAEPANPAIEAQLAQAHAVLYRTVNVTDPDTGEVTPKETETPLYRDYQDNQSNYFNARAAYMSAYMVAQSSDSGRATWPLLAPTLQIPVKQAYDKWRSNFADKVEQAIAIMDTSTKDALSKAFKKAKALYDGYGVVLDETGAGGPLTMRSYLLPSDWHSVNSATKWTTVDTRGGGLYRNSTSEFTSGGGSAGFSLGIFSIGGGGGHSVQHRHMASETRNLRFSFDYTLVSIRRPWLTFSLLATKRWNLSNLYKKGQVSNGAKTGQDNSIMPVLPTEMVVVRNVKISADWSKSDLDFMKQQTNAGGGFSIGPFSIAGNYANSKSKETFSAAWAGSTLIVPSVQIMGWIGQVLPFCPPA
jgi:hypothetical protein